MTRSVSLISASRSFFFILQEHIITWSTADARMGVRTVRNPAVGADFAGV